MPEILLPPPAKPATFAALLTMQKTFLKPLVLTAALAFASLPLVAADAKKDGKKEKAAPKPKPAARAATRSHIASSPGVAFPVHPSASQR